MKKLFLAACAIVALVSCGSAPKAIITAELANVEDQKVYIKEFVDGKFVDTDSASMVGGKFTVTTENVYPRQVVITFEKAPRMGKFIVVEEGTTLVKGDFAKFEEIAVTGTKTADMITAFTVECAPIETEIEQIATEYNTVARDTTLTQDEKAAKLEGFKVKYEELMNQNQAMVTAAIEKNSDNVFGAYLMSSKNPSSYDEIDALLAKASPNMPKNKFIDDLTSQKEKLASIRLGQMAPDFTVTTPEGQEISLSSLKGQVVLIDFWASWCGPCRASNPSVVALYAKYKDAGFTVFGVSLDKDKDAWMKAIADDQLTWNHGSDLKGWGAAPAKLYSVSGIPHTFLIDKEGKIAGDNLHGEELDAKVAELTAVTAPAAEATATETPAAE